MVKPSRLANASHLTACAYAFAKAMRCLTLSLAVFVLTGLSSLAADDFYKGKTIKLVVGSAPGAGYDAYGRLIARHIRKYIPGQPNVVVSYMPGADGLIAG